jgi:Derlin-2/3
MILRSNESFFASLHFYYLCPILFSPPACLIVGPGSWIQRPRHCFDANNGSKIINQAFGFGYGFFLRALNLALCYTVTQDQRGMQAGFFFFTIPAQLTPICTIAVTFLMTGPYLALLEIIGLFAAHLYDFLSRLWPEFGGGPTLIATPAIMSRLVQTPRVMSRSAGTAFRATRDESSGSTTGASTGPLPDSWRTRGPGQRLG